MATFLSQTLSADGNSSACTISPGRHGSFAIDITGTITITVKRSWNNVGPITIQKPDGITDAVFTADAQGIVVAPGDYIFTASGTSGGTAVIRMDEIPAT